MLFNSIEFVVFLLITYGLYRLLPFRPQNILLLVASYVFYAWWDIRFLFLILISTVVDFCCALLMDTGTLSLAKRRLVSGFLTLAAFLCVTLQWKESVQFGAAGVAVEWSRLFSSGGGWGVLLATIAAVAIGNALYPKLTTLEPATRRKTLLWISIVTNLVILGFFKYFNFFADSFAAVLRTIGFQPSALSLNLLLPIGISFYTFRTMSYVIDVYRSKIPAEQEFSVYALFLSFFPSLVAGPIDRASDLIPQLTQTRQITFEQTTRGLFLILFGLFKKLAIADGISTSVSAVYQTTGAVSWLDVALATVLYAVQIYCDFSGYSDMARGVAKLFGIDLMVNFNLPYFSKNPSEFWQRWHISLSSWLRDYLYISLGGNRKGNLRTYFNLMTTMVLGGLWHGATWNFVLWGFYQGALLCVYRFFSPKPVKGAEPAPQRSGGVKVAAAIGATLLFLVLTCYGWLLFGVTSFEKIAAFTQILFTGFGNFTLTMPKPSLAALLGLPILVVYELVQYFKGKTHFYLTLPTPLRGALYAAFIFIVLMGGSNAPAQFIYAQF